MNPQLSFDIAQSHWVKSKSGDGDVCTNTGAEAGVGEDAKGLPYL